MDKAWTTPAAASSQPSTSPSHQYQDINGLFDFVEGGSYPDLDSLPGFSV